MRGEGELLIEDVVIDLLMVKAVVGRHPYDKFVKECPETVIIEGIRVS